ncbi:MAG: ATP-binding cassette domain-containing protein [Bacteroidales bacterium]|nr:MAG: ATP-binding cassette domain-containing protein [Bacteroidales bacterium]
MSESILNALMQLFALIANTSQVSAKGKKIVEAFLRQHLTRRIANEYLDLFESYADFFNRDISAYSKYEEMGRETLIEYVQKVCHQIRKGLPQSDRIVVLIKLLEYVIEDNKITTLEKDVVDTVSKCFNIDETEANNIEYFIFHNDCEEIDPSFLLIIESHPKIREDILEGLWVEQNMPEWLEDSHKLYNESIAGRLTFLYIPSTGSFVMRYYGRTELYLDGKTITPGKAYIVEVGSIVKGPTVNSIYFSDLMSWLSKTKNRQKIVFAAENLDYTFRNSTNGIKNFSFSEESGQLIGIMGGSGVGKSTLLNLLTGKVKPKSGRVLINGHDIHIDKRTVEGIIGYVPQDDLLFEDLTVYQNLYYNAKLCFSNFTEFKVRQTVKRVLDDLDLWEIRDLRVGSPLNKMISGGQRKRLNFGLELMREPSILFVDEPTSGLSSSDSLMVMRLLKQQASNGRLVIVNIHQPSSKVFKLFDKLWVLDKGGYPIYQGNPVDAIVYFKTMSTQVNASESGCFQCGSINPDQILEIIEAKIVDEYGKQTNIRQKTPDEWNRLYNKNVQDQLKAKVHKDILPKNFFNIPNIEVQFKIFSIRNLLSKIGNKQYVLINLIEAPLLAFILAYFTKYTPGSEYILADNKNLPAYLFMSVVVSLFIGLTVSAEEIISDRKILERESFLNLSRFSYLNAKVFYLFALSALQMLMFVIIGNYVLEIHGLTFVFWLILFSTSCLANMMGLNISSGLNSIVSIYISIPFILVPQLLLSGTIVQFDNLHPSITKKVYVPLVGDIMSSRWAFEALAVEQFQNNQFEKLFFEQEMVMSESYFRTAFLIPRLQYKLEECNRWVDENRKSDQKFGSNLRIISNELKVLQKSTQLPPFDNIQMLNVSDFNEQISEETNGYLRYIKGHFTEISNNAGQKKDSIYSKLVDSLKTEGVFNLKKRNYNKALADWVLNTNEVTKFLETDSRIIQKHEPIFMLPDHPWGRAHFYAPMKFFNGQYVRTLWFNLAVIWLFSLMLFVTLQADVLRKLIDYFESIKLSRLLKKEIKKY